MEMSQFQAQISRLKNQWPAAYSDERLKLLWNAFKDVNGSDFKEAIDELLMTQRGAPLLDEMTKAVQLAKNRYFERQRMKEASIMGMMQQAAEVNETADPAFVQDCLNLLDQLLTKKITFAEFNQGCDLLSIAAKKFAQEKGYATTQSANSQNLPVRYNPSDT